MFAKLQGLTKAKPAKLSDKGEANLDQIYLYNDATNPVRSKASMRSYLAKLEILAGLSVA